MPDRPPSNPPFPRGRRISLSLGHRPGRTPETLPNVHAIFTRGEAGSVIILAVVLGPIFPRSDNRGPDATERLHADRAAGRDRDHRGPDRAPAAGRPVGTRG